MKLKKYNQYIKEDLTPMSGDIEDMTGELEGEIVGQDEFMDNDGDDTSTPPVNNMDEVEEEGNEYVGTKLMKELADKLGVNVENGMINFKDEYIEEEFIDSFNCGNTDYLTEIGKNIFYGRILNNTFCNLILEKIKLYE
jgi:hypothetical protein